MKKLFTALLLLVGFAAFSQTTGYFRYDSVRFEKVGGNSEFILLNSTRDSIGVLYNIGNGRTQFRTISSLGLSPNVRNGIRKSVDTLMLGDSLDRYTYIQVLSHLTNNSRFNHLRLGNLPEAQSLNGVVPPYPNMLTYNPSTFGVERIYSTANGDIDSAFYGGAISTITRILRDSTDIYFKAGVRKERLAGQGYEGVYQYFPPRDSMDMTVGRDGQSGNVGFFQFDLGNSWGYNLKVISQTDMPDYPMSLIRSSFDAMRVIDNTRTHKIVGNGWTGYLPMWKTYQTAITGSTYEAGNYTSKLSGFHVYGDAYPLIGSATTKDKILRVWKVDSAFGGIIEPMRRTTNTVYNGYSLWAKGDSDRMHIAGNLSLGGNLPTIDNGLVSSGYRIWNNGRYWGTDSLHAFIVDGYSLSARIPVTLGTQAGVNFSMTDSVQSAAILMNLPANRDARYLAIRVEGFNAATYPDNSTGMYIRFETGANHANVSRVSRNGNWTLGNSAAALDYRWWKKLAVDGGGVFRDTLRLEVAPLQVADDTTNYKVVVRHITTGDLLTMPWVGGSGGGGGGSGTVNSGTANRLSYYASTGTAVSELAAITANRALISDANGLPTHATTTDTEIGYLNGVTSAIQTQLDNRWSLAGNAAVSGSQTGSFIGTTNSVALRFGTNGSRRMYLDSARNQLILGPATVDANHALIINSLTNTNTHGIRLYYNNNAGSVEIGPGGIVKAGNYDINITSSGLSLRGLTGVLIGGDAHSTTVTALLQIAAGTTSKAPQKFTSGPLLTTVQAGTREYDNAHYSTNNALNRYAQGGAITDFITTVGNTGTTETDLYTYTTKANTFAANGEKLEAEFAGTATGVTTTARVLRVYFAGTVLATYQLGSTGTGVADWNVKATGIRSSSTEVRWTVNIISNVAGTVASFTDTGILTGLTLSGTNILKITGEVTGAGAGDNQLNANMGLVKWIGAANN